MAEDFSENWNFPHCVLAIDGKHVVIQVNKLNDVYIYVVKHILYIHKY